MTSKPPKTPSPEPEEKSPDALSAGQHFEGAHDDFGLTPRPREPKVRAQRADPLLGMDLGGVKIARLIGEGGMGRVYEARQEKPSRTVAVKIIRAGITSEKTMKRFEREAEFLARLQHPGIAQIFVVGAYESDLGSVPFYVMEFLADAKPITNYVHERGLALREKLRLFKQVCEAVAHGHDRGIVHRDLKPGNILVDSQGTPKVIDFGVARSTDSDLTLESMKTDTGQLIGTVQYMSPEQFGPDPDDLDARADVYSLGVVLYELLSGSTPYSVKKRALHEASRVVCEEIPPPVRVVNKAIPGDVSAIAERCLHKDRTRRYYTAGELAADLGRFLDGQPVRARSSSLALRYAARRLAESKLGLVALLVALSLAAFMLIARNSPSSKPPMGPQPSPAAEPTPSPAPARTPEQAPSPPLEREQAKASTLEVDSEWRPSGLFVRESNCYRLVVSGECSDKSGQSFTADGTAPAEARSPTNAPAADLDDKAVKEFFTNSYPRQMLTAKVSGAGVILAVGSGMTFIAPGEGELLFRINDQRFNSEGSHGLLGLELVPVPDPDFVAADGTTTFCTNVSQTNLLVFEPDGLRWEFGSILAMGKEDYPTLINGIAWWPERDVQNISRSRKLKTREFAWATGARASEPHIRLERGRNPSTGVSLEASADRFQALKFFNDGDRAADVSCTISQPISGI